MNNPSYIILFSFIFSLVGCTAGGNDPGIEYAPQMYHSVPYEPLTQFDDETTPTGIIESLYDYHPNSLPYNDYFNSGNGRLVNQKKPVSGTVRRQNFVSVTNSNIPAKDQPLYLYNIPKDSVVLAGKVLKNPLPNTSEVISEGKHLYLGFCAPCHGAKADGQGKVGVVYQGVANLLGGAYKNLPEGHIFHVITNGKGRMWAHASQLNPEERWKVVHYVKQLQQGGK